MGYNSIRCTEGAANRLKGGIEMASEKPKYPHSKKSFFARLKDKFSPPKCVYAGPEKFGKDGPGGVYAGPEYFEKKRPVGRVYAGPAPKNNEPDEPVNDVYAGPEFFEKDPVDPEPSEPETPTPPVALAYAAPAFFNRPEMPVYAGPQYFDPDSRPEPASWIPEKPTDRVPEVYGSGEYTCDACGAKFDGPFCPSCGTPRKNNGPIHV